MVLLSSDKETPLSVANGGGGWIAAEMAGRVGADWR
jgi:hypothetical protein